MQKHKEYFINSKNYSDNNNYNYINNKILKDNSSTINSSLILSQQDISLNYQSDITNFNNNLDNLKERNLCSNDMLNDNTTIKSYLPSLVNASLSDVTDYNYYSKHRHPNYNNYRLLHEQNMKYNIDAANLKDKLKQNEFLEKQLLSLRMKKEVNKLKNEKFQFYFYLIFILDRSRKSSQNFSNAKLK